MTTRGLPGFLRRSRRSDDYDDDDDDDDEDISDKIHSTQQQQQPPIPLKQQQQGSTSRENSYGFSSSGVGGALNTFGSSSLSEELRNERQTDENNNNDKRRTGKLKGTTFLSSSSSSTQTPSSSSSSSLNYSGTTAGYNTSTATSVGHHHNSSSGSLSNINENEINDYGDNNNEDINNNKNNNNNGEYTAKAITTDDDHINNNDNNTDNTTTTTTTTKSSSPRIIMERKYSYRETQFDKIIKADVVQMSELRKLGWNGIPPEHRAMAWKIMLGYLPTNKQRRVTTLERKRAEYKDTIKQHYDIPDDSRTIQEQETLRQVLVDVPRTAPEIPLFRNERIKRALGRLLYIWAIRHPASSYVQGINDLATPLFCVFLSDYYNGQDVQDGNVMVVISDERLQEVEADVYWCLTNILAGIQDHYTADQPGVQRMVMRLEELVRRIDSNLCEHFATTGIQFMQFAFKWMNCLLLREFNLCCVIRLWDTYISEDQNGSSIGGFENFHVYVCAAFLCQFSQPLQEMGFDELFGFMQEVPTNDWGETEIEMLLSQAYVLSTLFGGSDAHLNSNS